MPGFCNPVDVREALQDKELKGSADAALVNARIEAFSSWFAKATNSWWYDSSGSITGTDADGNTSTIPTSSTTATDVTLDVPASPHDQRDTLFHDEEVWYPVTHAGPYAKIALPHPWVQSLVKLEVRDLGGGTTDWVASSEHTEGRGKDYYVEQPGQESYGRSYLYLRAQSMGPRYNYSNAITLDYDHGRDWATSEWSDVRRGVAHFVAADLKSDSDLVAQIPDNGNLVGVQTQHDNLLATAKSFLNPHLGRTGGEQ